MHHYHEITRPLINALLPARCVLCRAPTHRDIMLCQPCEQDIKINQTTCQTCARPLEGYENLLCGQCQQHSPSFDHSLAPFIYRDPIRQLIIDLKFNEKLRNARLLAQLFLQEVRPDTLPEALIPIPLHPSRTRERGYNQSLELAHELSRMTGIAVNADSCRRIVNTERQSDLPMKAKKKNVKNAFSVDTLLSGQHVAIIDDVMTSGHTADELARILKRQGVARVDVWVMARAGKGTA